MSARGYYSSCFNGQARTYVGADLVHVLELKQRYNKVNTGAIAKLLSQLSAEGTQTSTGTNRYEVALRGAGWVRLQWYPEFNGLEVTISDRETHRDDEVPSVRREYEAILRRITPVLQTYGATTVGATTISGLPVPPVGITIYHSVGDRADAVKQMTIDWNALYQTLATEVGEIPTSPAQVDWTKRPPDVQKAREEELAAWKLIDTLPVAQRSAAIKRARDLTERRGQVYVASFDPKKVAWWKSYAAPLFKQWQRFKVDQLGGDRTVADDYIAFAERWQTNWDVYENWKKRLDALRAEATKRGFVVDAPKPTELPTTVWADAADVVKEGAGKVAGGVGDVWKTVKYGVWGALGIGALVAITSVVSNLRSGKDPADKYVEMIRGRGGRAGRTPRKLAGSREQLALASGSEDT